MLPHAPFGLSVGPNQLVHILVTCLLFGVDRRADAQASWRVDTAPLLSIRSTDSSGRAVFEHIVSGVRRSDGSVLLVDDAAAAVHVFDARGVHSRTLGRRGSGPGEFQHAWWVGACRADSTFVLDFVLRRVTVLDESATPRRTFTIPATGGPPGPPFAVGCNRAGVLVYQPIAPPPQRQRLATENRPSRGLAPIVLTDDAGSARIPADSLPSVELFASGGGGEPRPLGRPTSVAVGTDRVFVGTAESAVVLAFDFRGRSVGMLRVPTSTRTATTKSMRAAVDHMLASVHGPSHDAVRQLRERLMALPLPEQLPPYDAILVDASDVLWVVSGLPGYDRTDLVAMSKSGSHVASVSIPLGLQVVDIGVDYVLGALVAADGEQEVRLLRLQRTR